MILAKRKVSLHHGIVSGAYGKQAQWRPSCTLYLICLLLSYCALAMMVMYMGISPLNMWMHWS